MWKQWNPWPVTLHCPNSSSPLSTRTPCSAVIASPDSSSVQKPSFEPSQMRTELNWSPPVRKPVQMRLTTPHRQCDRSGHWRVESPMKETYEELLGPEWDLQPVPGEAPEKGEPATWEAAKLKHVGAPVPRLDGKEKVTGSARYTTDIQLEDAPCIRHSKPKPAGIVKEMELEEVKNAPGVLAVHPVVAVGATLRYEGQPMVAIAATSLSGPEKPPSKRKSGWRPGPMSSQWMRRWIPMARLSIRRPRPLRKRKAAHSGEFERPCHRRATV